MSLWFKHDAHFHEHPKCIRLRRLAGVKADSAEVGWWRIVGAAKRLGDWSFEDEEHLREAAGRYYGFVSLYRSVGLLDGLTIHNAKEYQAPLTGAERTAAHRAHKGPSDVTPSVTPDVTGVTPREEKSREERVETRDGVTSKDPIDRIVDIWMSVKYRLPTEKQRAFLFAYLQTFDVSGEARAERLILANPQDPIDAMKKDLAEFRGERIKQLEDEVKAPPPRRAPGLPQTTREILAEMQKLETERGAA
jgi:hypothetical protein